jgi:hypothetical protein
VRRQMYEIGSTKSFPLGLRVVRAEGSGRRSIASVENKRSGVRTHAIMGYNIFRNSKLQCRTVYQVDQALMSPCDTLKHSLDDKRSSKSHQRDALSQAVGRFRLQESGITYADRPVLTIRKQTESRPASRQATGRGELPAT